MVESIAQTMQSKCEQHEIPFVWQLLGMLVPGGRY
jgi:hypothetical protein